MKKLLLALSMILGLTTAKAQTAFDIIQLSPDHNILEAAVVAAGLDVALGTLDPITVFAPTDAAFNALPAGTVDALLNDIPALTNILLYHVLDGAAVLSTQLSDGQIATMLNGDDITVTINNGVFINGTSQVVLADVPASNGVIHIVNAVLLPPPPVVQTSVWDIIVNSPDHTTLENLVGLAGLDGLLDGPGTFTVFAPTDAAFALLPQPVVNTLLADPSGALAFILTYHVVPSTALSTDLSDGQFITTAAGLDVIVTITNGNVFINHAQVIVADIVTDNGVVHVIDAVIAPGIIANNVMEIIADSPSHTILETAIGAAGLQTTLENEYFYTVFAPVDDAFAALPAGTVPSLLANPAALTDVLLYHAVGQIIGSADLVDGQVVTMLQGDDATITLPMGGAMINNANIVAADLNAWNGVVHVIDAVLLPPASVESLQTLSVSAFPNPCTNNITVQSSDNNNELFQVVNAAGQTVAQGKLNGKQTVVNTSEFASGVYTIFVQNGARVNFIKE